MEKHLTWLLAKDMPADEYPEWKRSVAITEDGEVFIPAAHSGRQERVVMMFCAFDAAPCFVSMGHLYVPARWMGETFKDLAELCDQLIKNVTTGYQLGLLRN